MAWTRQSKPVAKEKVEQIPVVSVSKDWVDLPDGVRWYFLESDVGARLTWIGCQGVSTFSYIEKAAPGREWREAFSRRVESSVACRMRLSYDRERPVRSPDPPSPPGPVVPGAGEQAGGDPVAEPLLRVDGVEGVARVSESSRPSVVEGG